LKTDPFDELKLFGEDLAGAVPAARSRAAVARALGTATLTERRRLKAPALATAMLGGFVVLNFAGAALADSAVPGDPLYPLDRSYEWVSDTIGFGGDRTDERLDEISVLTERSDYARALDLMAGSLVSEEVAAAARAINDAQLSSADRAERVAALVAAAHRIRSAQMAGDNVARAAAEEQARGAGANLVEPPGRPENTPAVTAPGNSGEEPAGPDNPPGAPANPGPGVDTPGATAPGSSGDRPATPAPGNTDANPGVTAPRGNQGSQGNSGRP
jgi:hypothetical protein